MMHRFFYSRGIRIMSCLTLIMGILFILLPGCIPSHWEPSTHKKIREPTWVTDEEIISMVRKGIMDWADARAVSIRKDYTWWKAEMKLKAHIPEKDWIK